MVSNYRKPWSKKTIKPTKYHTNHNWISNIDCFHFLSLFYRSTIQAQFLCQSNFVCFMIIYFLFCSFIHVVILWFFFILFFVFHTKYKKCCREIRVLLTDNKNIEFHPYYHTVINNKNKFFFLLFFRETATELWNIYPQALDFKRG